MYLDKNTLPPMLRVTEADEDFALEHSKEEVSARIREQTAALLGQLFLESGSSETAWSYSVPLAIRALDGSVVITNAVKAGVSQASSELYLSNFPLNEGRTDYPWVKSKGTGARVL
jgi:hypothetical protein